MHHRQVMLKAAGVVIAAAFGQSMISPAFAAEMAIGDVVPPPVGYVDFCQREPADCPGGAQAQGFGKTYWSLAFHEGVPSSAWRSASHYAPSSLYQPRDARPSGRSDPATAAPLATGAAAAHKIPATPELWATLDRVNRGVNARVIPTSDRVSHHVEDYWSLPLSDGDRRGDCEDYALEKRHQLMALGYPQEALSLALVRTRWDENHAVLLVETTAGTYVLDSNSTWVAPWESLDYHWLVRQSSQDPSRWVEIVNHGR